MTIERIIDGKRCAFDLTDGELLKAYYEQERISDFDYVKGELSEELSELCVDEADRQNTIKAIVYEMRRQINEYDLQSYALEKAFSEIKEQRKSGELQ